MKTFMVILMGFIGVSAMYSQDKPASPKYALSFGIADNFRLDKFIMDIGITKILDDEHQLRVFISPRIYTNNSNQENVMGNIAKGIDEATHNSFGIGTDFLWILINEDDLRMYGGPGLVYTIGLEDSKSTSEYANGDKYVREDRIPFYNIGVKGNLGVEWMVSKRISLHSEYVLTGLYGKQKRDSNVWVNGVKDQASDHRRTTTSFSLATGVLFGVSIYL
ncbi:MAG: hypothetical protein WC209_16965 [Ignavibacteriaceae bacterium]